MLNQPVTKGQKLDDSTWMRCLEAVTLTHTEAEWWLPGTGAGGLTGQLRFNDFQFRKIKKPQQWTAVVASKQRECTLCHWTAHF